jgi:hypothetical protein
MKILLVTLALLSSVKSFAQDYRIRVSNLGYMIDVQIYNHSASNLSCSGMIFFQTSRGQETRFLNEFVWAGSSAFRTIYPMSFNDRIYHAGHSIRCRPSR